MIRCSKLFPAATCATHSKVQDSQWTILVLPSILRQVKLFQRKEHPNVLFATPKATRQFRRRAFCRTAPRLLKRPVCGCFAGLVTHNGSVESMLIISTLFASSLSCRLEVCHMGKDSGRSLLFFFELSFKLPVSRSFSSRAFLRWCFLHQERAVEVPKLHLVLDTSYFPFEFSFN